MESPEDISVAFLAMNLPDGVNLKPGVREAFQTEIVLSLSLCGSKHSEFADALRIRPALSSFRKLKVSPGTLPRDFGASCQAVLRPLAT